MDATYDPYPVFVREYRRLREGNLETVRSHGRRARRWGKRPKSVTSS